MQMAMIAVPSPMTDWPARPLTLNLRECRAKLAKVQGSEQRISMPPVAGGPGDRSHREESGEAVIANRSGAPPRFAPIRPMLASRAG